MTKKTIP